ncbi:uncharacterized protein LOC132608091 [Lycium barbarum]|uniref:uncharacterized protein LOC132608091 n=1 Tax=Lycium barbarum TaxID=112863 RepID=UPI00293EAFB9|nr:uncharacterized protein LOC132608091 [Lycium barbarum]
MNSFNFQQNIIVEKNNVILTYKRLQIVTSLFRFIELCIFLFVISKFSTQILPSAEYLKRLCITLISPPFVFVLGNAIVIILFLLKSCQSSTKEGSIVNPKADSHDDTTVDFFKACISSGGQVKRKIYRSQSEKLTTNKLSHAEGPHNRELRRSATVACRRYGEKPAAEISCEEFRHTVEALIARQQKLLREEEFSAVVSSEA